MPKFQVGDRVVMNDHSWGGGRSWAGQEGVVGKIKPAGEDTTYVCVHFDDPQYEKSQSYTGGWPDVCFDLAYQPSDFVDDLS